jgi:O-antigen ligase
MPLIFASLIVLAPLYVWRFSIGGLPTNFLMLASFAVIGLAFLFVLRQGLTREKIHRLFADLKRPLLIGILLFCLASLISLFAFGINGEKLAQWAVLYVQPIALFFLIRYLYLDATEIEQQKWRNYFQRAAYIVVGLAGLLALAQYFTLATLPAQWWGNANEPKRAIAFFAHANAFGLYVTPLLAWLLPDAMQKLREQWGTWKTDLVWPVLWSLGLVGMFLSLSRGAWMGIVAAAVVYVLLAANKKMVLGFLALGIIVAGIVAITPNLRYRVLLPFYGEKSAVARLSLWHTAGTEIADNPILGKGVNGFSENWDQYNKDGGLEHYNFPHNIFLNFWIDAGLLGLVSVLLILIAASVQGIKQWRTGRTNVVALGIVLFVVAMVVHGLIDIPYFKNDLALAFWLMLAISI